MLKKKVKNETKIDENRNEEINIIDFHVPSCLGMTEDRSFQFDMNGNHHL